MGDKALLCPAGENEPPQLCPHHTGRRRTRSRYFHFIHYQVHRSEVMQGSEAQLIPWGVAGRKSCSPLSGLAPSTRVWVLADAPRGVPGPGLNTTCFLPREHSGAALLSRGEIYEVLGSRGL